MPSASSATISPSRIVERSFNRLTDLVVAPDVKIITVPRVEGLGGGVSHLPIRIRDVVGAGPSRERASALSVLDAIHASWAVASQAEHAGGVGLSEIRSPGREGSRKREHPKQFE